MIYNYIVLLFNKLSIVQLEKIYYKNIDTYIKRHKYCFKTYRIAHSIFTGSYKSNNKIIIRITSGKISSIRYLLKRVDNDIQ